MKRAVQDYTLWFILYFRYGRTTVATLETKLASAEKDIARLTKAMERSDKYIEELESELDGYRGTNSGASGKRDKYMTNGDADSRKVMSDSKLAQYSAYKSGPDSGLRRQLFSEDKESSRSAASTGERSKYYYDRNGDDRGASDHRQPYSDYSNDVNAGKSTQSAKNGVSSNGKKRVTFDLEKNTNATMSFDLELPSPLKSSGNRNGLSNGRTSPVKGVLKKPGGKGPMEDKSVDSYTDLSRTADESDIYTSKSTSRQSKDDLYTKSRSRSEERDYKSDNLYSKSKKKYSADDSFLSEPSSMEVKSLTDFDYGSKRAGDRKNDVYDRKGNEYDTKRRDLSKSYDSDLTRDDLEDTQCIESELDELNISLTPEFTDCMKLLNRAEKKVHTHDTSDEDETVPRYRSSQDTDTDTAFRASTGSIGYKPVTTDDLRASTGSYGYKSSTGDDFLSSYKSDTGTNRFTSSLDSYSRGRHVRSGSLDNLFTDRSVGGRDERPSSALPTTSNMYPSTSSAHNKYTTGLTTGRTTLTRSPSFDNLLMSRPSTVEYLPGQSMNRYSVGRSYRGENESTKLDVNANINTGTGSTVPSLQKPVTGVHGLLGDVETGLDRPQENRATVTFDSVLQARARSMSDMSSELDRMAPSASGRLTPTLSGSSSTGGRVTPTIPTHSEYMASSKPAYPSTGSGRSTPTLTSTSTNYDPLTKPNLQYSDYKSSSTVDMALKPPTGLKPDLHPSLPSYLTSSSHTAPSHQFSSLPVYSSTVGAAAQFDSKGDNAPMSAPYSSNRYPESASKNEFNYSEFNIGARPGSITSSNNQPTYTSGDKFNSLSSYNNGNFMDSDLTSYSSKGVAGVPVSSSTNSSALFTGSSSSSSSLYGYTSSSYLPSSGTSVSSYTSALSVPHQPHTTSSYTSSAPLASYSSKSLDPIAESSNHYSYVSNASGDFSSKNDTFGLPEPKKRLFDDSEDLNLSVSPIKSNRRF